MTHITRVLALVLAMLFVSTAGLTACAPANEAVLVSTPKFTPTTTATPTPEPTLTPTPTPIPTQTPSQQLTIEEQMSNLIIFEYDINEYYIDTDSAIVFYFLLDGLEKYLFSVPFCYTSNSTKWYIIDMFTEEVIFTVPEDELSANANPDYIPDNSKYTVVAKGYSGCSIEMLKVFNIIDFPNELYWRTGKNIMGSQAAKTLFSVEFGSYSLATYAQVYLEALNDSEKVFHSQYSSNEKQFPTPTI